MSVLADLVDDPLVGEDLPTISIVPSKRAADRVTKVSSVGVETAELYECNVQTNTDYEQIHMETQTDVKERYTDPKDVHVDQEYLGNWLDSVYSRVANHLEQNLSHKAFANYKVNLDDALDTNKLLYTLETNFEYADHGAAEEEDHDYATDNIEDEFADYNMATRSDIKSTTVDDEESKALGFDITSISWSCNGSSIAVAYGKQNHPSMSFQGCVSIWGIFRRDMDPKKPSENIEVSNCVTSLKFHPSDPSILAGGTFIGEIYLWNVFNEEPEICRSRADEYYHREPVTQLVWISQQQMGGFNFTHNLISTSTDGKILIWNPENKLSHPIRGHLLARKKKGELNVLGGTALDVNCKDINTFIVGTEGGSIFKCNLPLTSFSDKIAAAGAFDGFQKKLRWKKEAEDVMNTITNKVGMEKVKQEVERYCMDRSIKEVEAVHIFNAKPEIKFLFSVPFNLSYEKHFGPCQAISCSPFHRKIFLTCSIDGTVKMYDIINTRCIASFEPSFNEYLMDVCFSPIRPAVFAVVGSKGIPYIYDLTVSRQSPVYTLEDDKDGNVSRFKGGVKIAFNPRQRDFLAVGQMEGHTKIYKINQSLSNLKPKEIEVLNEMLLDSED